MNITLQQLHQLLADAYAVSVNDTLYFVGYDEDENPYIADNDGNDYIDFSTVDGEINIDKYTATFEVAEQPIQIVFLQSKNLLQDYPSLT